MSKHTFEQERWLKMRAAAKKGDFVVGRAFANCALLINGSMACGLTKNTIQRCYSATYIKIDGKIVAHGMSWDYTGSSLDNVDEGGDLNMKTINIGVRVI